MDKLDSYVTIKLPIIDYLILNKTNKPSSSLKTHAFRLRPNQDLNKELDDFVRKNDLKAAFIMTCVGSLTKATIRMAYGIQYDYAIDSNNLIITHDFIVLIHHR